MDRQGHIRLHWPHFRRKARCRIACAARLGRALREEGRSRRPIPGFLAARTRQGLMYAVVQELVHGAAVAETHFDFGRVHIHVHTERVEI